MPPVTNISPCILLNCNFFSSGRGSGAALYGPSDAEIQPTQFGSMIMRSKCIIVSKILLVFRSCRDSFNHSADGILIRLFDGYVFYCKSESAGMMNPVLSKSRKA
jgi:hypothetical protein